MDEGDVVIFPDPEDCSAFCQCSGGTAYRKYCQDGTYYDEDLRVCNWPDFVSFFVHPGIGYQGN